MERTHLIECIELVERIEFATFLVSEKLLCSSINSSKASSLEKTNANRVTTQPKRKRQKLTTAESRQMENIGCEILNDSIEVKRRELDKEHLQEFEKKMHAEERGEAFDELILEQIGKKIEELEAALGNINKEEEDYTIEKEKTLIEPKTIKIIKLIISYLLKQTVKLKFLYLLEK